MKTQKQMAQERFDAVLKRDGRVCRYCGKEKLYKGKFHIDHIYPRKVGGEDSIDNLIVACKQCNTRKSATPVQLYIERRLAEIEKEKTCLAEFREYLANIE
jgi:5-methylcytosine-specific restriction endonuclease McrA